MRQASTYLFAVLALGLAACSADSDVTRAIGARCERHDECAERCLVDAEAYPGGFCSLSCITDNDCPEGALCVAEDGGVCLFACASDADCEFLDIGWTCKSKDAQQSGEVSVCIGD